jgi:tetratricopeptide (TPR) repeat protein
MWWRTSLFLLLALFIGGCSGVKPVIKNEKEYFEKTQLVVDHTLAAMAKAEQGTPLAKVDEQALETALSDLDPLIAYDPKRFQPYMLKARFLRALGREDEAKAASDQARLVIPTKTAPSEDAFVADAHYELAVNAYEAGDSEQALADAKLADSKFATGKYKLMQARALVQLKRIDEAKVILKPLLTESQVSKEAQSLLKFLEGAEVSSASSPTGAGTP